ncbi:MAG: cell division protein ZapB [Oscillospiraceae bacterium]|nr:cell division protein ZapB [Oscillospiraceae bacterium]MCL2278353.1 cell division protein ZapB [Oscillospiraceae bacterium]
MKKRIYVVLVCAVMLFMIITLTACADETVPLQERIYTLEAENAALVETISDLRTENERIQTLQTNAQRELNAILAMLEAQEQEQAQAEEQATAGNQVGALAITYAGVPNADMTWPYDSDLPLGLRVNLDDFYDDVEIEWTSTNENIFTVTQREDGLGATVTPRTNGSARVVVTIGDQETESWVRISGMG